MIGIRGLTSSSAALPLMIDCPNLSPNPLSACAAALSVRLTLTGSTFSAIEVMVWNSVLISVVTDRASITFVRRDPLRQWVFRRGHRHVLLAEHRGGHDLRVHVRRNQVQVLGIDVQGELGRGLAVAFDLVDLGHPADLHTVVGDLRTRVHHQPGPVGQHGQLGLVDEVAAVLQVHQPQHERGNQKDDDAGDPERLERRFVDFPAWMRHSRPTP